MRRWGFALVVLAVTTLGSTAPPALASGYAPAAVAFNFADVRINESSGVASATLSPGVIFTHNDSGDLPRLFAVGPTGETIATYTVAGAGAVDWEDMARGPASSGTGSSLYLADIGNNLRNRGVLDVYEIAEPVVTAGTNTTVPLLSVRHLAYDDIRHDAETLFVNPLTGDLVVVAKEFHGMSNVYVARGNALIRVATVAMPLVMTPNPGAVMGPLGGTQITGGAMNDTGTKIVLRTYKEAFEWTFTGSYDTTFAAAPLTVALPATIQGEAITYTPAGDLLTTTEGVRGPVHRLSPA